MIRLYRLDRRVVTDKKELDELAKNIRKNMLFFNGPTIPPP
jgi:hypothetical protein